MIEELHTYLVNFVGIRFTVFPILFLICIAWPIAESILFKYPDNRATLNNAIKKRIPRMLVSTLPLGFVSGLTFLDSSDSVYDLIYIPLTMAGFTLLMGAGFFFAIIRVENRYYKNRK